MREKLNEDEKKVRLTITLHPKIMEAIKANHKNISRAIETMLYTTLKDNSLIEPLKF
jgi:hypothetical protein